MTVLGKLGFNAQQKVWENGHNAGHGQWKSGVLTTNGAHAPGEVPRTRLENKRDRGREFKLSRERSSKKMQEGRPRLGEGHCREGAWNASTRRGEASGIKMRLPRSPGGF